MLDGKPNWDNSTTSRLETAHLGGPCRVCGGAIAAREEALMVPWRIGIAHPACGYLKADEEAVHEVRTERARWWAWRCPTCRRDATSMRQPRDGDPLVCRRCHVPPLVIGAEVEAQGSGLRAIAGMRQRSAYIRLFDRGLVTGMDADRITVAWEGTQHRPAVTTRARAVELRVVR